MLIDLVIVFVSPARILKGQGRGNDEKLIPFLGIVPVSTLGISQTNTIAAVLELDRLRHREGNITALFNKSPSPHHARISLLLIQVKGLLPARRKPDTKEEHKQKRYRYE
jgi:hypothetical protein